MCFGLFFVWVAWRYRFGIPIIVIISISISFFLNASNVEYSPIATFYLPQYRFWEFIFGGLLAYHQLSKIAIIDFFCVEFISISENKLKNSQNLFREILSVIGFVLIIFSFIFINKNSVFPGFCALLPVLGTGLLISQGPNTYIHQLFFSNRILVWLGLISYPLYLWHWPLLSFAEIFYGGYPSWKVRIFLIFLSGILAWMTYKLVEQPIRFGKNQKFKTLILLCSIFVVLILGALIHRNDGFPDRFFARKYLSFEVTVHPSIERCKGLPGAYKINEEWFCILGNKDVAPTIFVYGDSHALNLVPALEQYANNKNISMLLSHRAGCNPLLGLKIKRGDDWQTNDNCPQLNEAIFDYVKKII
jgi:hypothetical protein